MAEHSCKIVERKTLSDGAIAFRARCCDDPTTDSWHTMYIANDAQHAELLAKDPANPKHLVAVDGLVDENHIAEELEKHRNRVASRHAARSHAESVFDKFLDV